MAGEPGRNVSALLTPSIKHSFQSESLGCSHFRSDHRLRYAYIAGAMYKGIASVDLVVRMGKNRLLGYLGTGGMRLETIEACIQEIRSRLSLEDSFGMNLLSNAIKPELEEATVELYLRQNIRRVEAAAFTYLTPALVYYRVKGLSLDSANSVQVPNHILAKVSHPELARAFMSPPPATIIQRLLEEKRITADEARLSERIPMAYDICVEADSGGHTDRGVAYVLMPVITGIRDQLMAAHRFTKRIRVGAAGGIGTPQAIAAALVLGADFVLTGSINQCSVEAGTSDLVKDMLSAANIQDTAMAPAGDMFEMGAKVQVLRKGVFFPARANQLYELYRRLDSIDQLDTKTKGMLEDRFFGRSLEAVWEETRNFYLEHAPDQLKEAERLPKRKMALIFQWYFVHSNRLAQQGVQEGKVNFQIQCGPALGAFNQWVKGSHLENWRNRHVDLMATSLMEGAAEYLQKWCALQVSNLLSGVSIP